MVVLRKKDYGGKWHHLLNDIKTYMISLWLLPNSYNQKCPPNRAEGTNYVLGYQVAKNMLVFFHHTKRSFQHDVVNILIWCWLDASSFSSITKCKVRFIECKIMNGKIRWPFPPYQYQLWYDLNQRYKIQKGHASICICFTRLNSKLIYLKLLWDSRFSRKLVHRL